MKKYLATLLVLGLSTIATVKAIECFNCVYYHPDEPGVRSPSSCRSNKTSKSAFLRNCNDLEYDLHYLGPNTMIGISKNSALRLEPSPTTRKTSSLFLNQSSTQPITQSCFKLTLQGQSLRNKAAMEFTQRGCLLVFDVNETVPNVCYNDTSSKIQEKVKENALQFLLEKYQSEFTGESYAGICNCMDANECNVGISTVSMSPWVLLTLSLFVNLKKYLYLY